MSPLKEWNPRYVAYAKAHGVTDPDTMKARDQVPLSYGPSAVPHFDHRNLRLQQCPVFWLWQLAPRSVASVLPHGVCLDTHHGDQRKERKQMKITIPIEFEITPVESEDIEEADATAAAENAAFNYLSLVEISGYSSDSESVRVHVDGFGECDVSLTEGG